MVKYILFADPLRQEEVEKFYMICQKHRDYYRSYPTAYHPLKYFIEPDYAFQCPMEMTTAYLMFPPYHVKYKQPAVLAQETGRTSDIPPLPERTLVARYGATAKSFIR